MIVSVLAYHDRLHGLKHHWHKSLKHRSHLLRRLGMSCRRTLHRTLAGSISQFQTCRPLRNASIQLQQLRPLGLARTRLLTSIGMPLRILRQLLRIIWQCQNVRRINSGKVLAFFKRLEAEFQASFTVVKVDRNSNGVLEGWYKSKRAVIQALLPSEGFRKPRRHR